MKFIIVMVCTQCVCVVRTQCVCGAHSLSLALIHRCSHILSELHVNLLQGFVILAEKQDVVLLVFQESTENTSHRKHFSGFSLHIYGKLSNQRMCWCSENENKVKSVGNNELNLNIKHLHVGTFSVGLIVFFSPLILVLFLSFLPSFTNALNSSSHVLPPLSCLQFSPPLLSAHRSRLRKLLKKQAGIVVYRAYFKICEVKLLSLSDCSNLWQHTKTIPLKPFSMSLRSNLFALINERFINNSRFLCVLSHQVKVSAFYKR